MTRHFTQSYRYTNNKGTRQAHRGTHEAPTYALLIPVVVGFTISKVEISRGSVIQPVIPGKVILHADPNAALAEVLTLQ